MWAIVIGLEDESLIYITTRIIHTFFLLNTFLIFFLSEEDSALILCSGASYVEISMSSLRYRSG